MSEVKYCQAVSGKRCKYLASGDFTTQDDNGNAVSVNLCRTHANYFNRHHSILVSRLVRGYKHYEPKVLRVYWASSPLEESA